MKRQCGIRFVEVKIIKVPIILKMSSQHIHPEHELIFHCSLINCPDRNTRSSRVNKLKQLHTTHGAQTAQTAQQQLF